MSQIYFYTRTPVVILVFLYEKSVQLYIFILHSLEREREIKSQQDKTDLVLQVYHHRHSTVSLHSQIIANMYIKVNKTIKRLNVYEMSYLLIHS